MTLLKTLVAEAREKYNYSPNVCHLRGKFHSGFRRVYKQKHPRARKGYLWTYQIQKNGERKTITNKDLNILKHKVEEQGLPWEVKDEEKARQTVESEGHAWETFTKKK